MLEAAEIERMRREEMNRLRSKPTPQEILQRALIRSARIGFGLVAMGLALWLFSSVAELSSKPIGSMTIRDLAALVFQALVGLWAFVGSFAIAFGEAPPRIVDEAALQAQADQLVQARLRWREVHSPEGRAERLRTDAWYRLGLQTRKMIARHRLLAWAAAVGLYALLIHFLTHRAP